MVTGPPPGDGESFAVLDGFTITGGNANGTQDADKQGGGMYISYSSPTVTNCTFTANCAADTGGGLRIIAGSPVVSNCAFLGNAAGGGAGISVSDGAPRLTNCWFIANTAQSSGGGLSFKEYSHPALTNCLFAANSAGWSGGGLYSQDATGTLTNSTFAGNEAGFSGGAICCSNATVTVQNAILWQNMAPQGHEIAIQGYSAFLAVTRSDVLGGQSEVLTQGGGTLDWAVTGNLDADPLFVDPDGPDDIAGTEDDDLRLLGGSPCIGEGDNNAVPEGVETDLDGNCRIIDGDVDMGAYEFLTLPDVQPANEADLRDLAAFQCCFGQDTPACLDDFNWRPACDEIDLNDYAVLYAFLPPPGGRGGAMGGDGEGESGAGGIESQDARAESDDADEPPPDESVPWTWIEAGLAFEVRRVGGGGAVSVLAPHTAYELHYQAEYEAVQGYVLATVGTSPDIALTGAKPPARGAWAETGEFLWLNLIEELGAPSPATGYPEGYFFYDLVLDTAEAGPRGHLCTFTTGSSGELHLLLHMWWSDEARRCTVYMPARARFLVSRE